MKTIGMIGGMSWESTLEYYRIVNQEVKARLGGLHSAKCLLYSVDFEEIEKLQHESRWEEAGEVLSRVAQDLERGGADFILICTNTMHKVAAEVEESVAIPLLNIADATAEKIKAAGVQKIALLGTRFTMEENFYKGRLVDIFGLDVLVPSEPEMEVIHRVIYEELCLGKIDSNSRRKYIDVIDRLVGEGAEGVILGCTEIGLLVKQEDTDVPLFDTTEIHARAAVEYALTP
ncbi:MAG: aspartate/glutamate racemase family protein [Thermodesulfobacteriota bacterium]